MCSPSRGDVDTVQLDVSAWNRVTAKELACLTTGLSTRYLAEGHVFDCNSCWVCMSCGCVWVSGRGGGCMCVQKTGLFTYLFVCFLFVCLLIIFYAGLKACMVAKKLSPLVLFLQCEWGQ